MHKTFPGIIAVSLFSLVIISCNDINKDSDYTKSGNDWPGWRGPDHNGTVVDSDFKSSLLTENNEV